MAKRSTRSSGQTPSSGADAAPFAVVAVAVCSASLGSLETLFTALEPGMGAAYVIALRQQDGLTVDAVVETLTGVGRIPVSVALDGERLQPDHVYVGGADQLTTVVDGHMRAVRSEQPVWERGAVDSLLISVSEQWGDHSVAVLMHGLGSEGTAGVTATKQSGGLSIGEQGAEESEAGAAGAAGPAGVVDLLLPLEAIPAHVALYLRNLKTLGKAAATAAPEPEVAAQIGRIAGILRSATGNDFHGYKHNTFLRRVARRMQVVQLEEIDDYIARLRRDPDEVRHLFQDLLIGVTQFFRDPAEFELLARDVMPKLFHGKAADDQVRVWVLGCATGEEAYSLAILLREHMATLDVAPHVQIFATDLDARALGLARAGRYSDAIAKHVSAERLARWFIREGNTYCVAKELREMCIFSPHNVIKDAPFSRIDLLSCRNLLIYLNMELQKRVIPIFHFSLRADGYLFLGSSENVTRHAKLFAPVDRKARIFRRLETATRILPDFPLSTRGERLQPTFEAAGAERTRPLSVTVGRRVEQIAERYAPAYVLIDAQYDVLHFSGRMGRYLEPAAGAASLNLLGLVSRDLRLDLRGALQKAVAENRKIEIGPLQTKVDDRDAAVIATVEPVAVGPGEPSMLMVLFQDGGPLPAEAPRLSGLVSDEHVHRLEAELRVTKERLQTTIEELESTNEELKSSNEEYQSINEEMQSANEELETSKEELQSVNEELQTVNGELAHRVAELARANSDLKNLLESTQIATIFLDNDLRVRSFTPAATEVFNVLDTDEGRPIWHLAPQVVYPELSDDVRKVLKTLTPVEREVAATEGDRCFIARVLPYRSLDNFIAGAVVSFVDITSASRAEAALRESEERFRTLFEFSAVGQAQADPRTLRLRAVNPRLCELTGFSAEELTRRSLTTLVLPEDRDGLGDWGNELGSGDLAEHSGELRLVRKDGSSFWARLSAAAFRDDKGAVAGVAVIVQDVAETKAAHERQATLLAELQHRTRNLLAVIRSVASRTAESTETVEDFLSHLQGRLAAIARTQASLTRSTEVSVSLGEILSDEFLAVAADDGQVTIEGPEVRLRGKAAETMSLGLHELTTNALKYGALMSRNGKLSVLWSIEGGADKVLQLTWRETGVSTIDLTPARTGFGRRLIEQVLPYELGAQTRLSFQPGGVQADIQLRLDDTNSDLSESELSEAEAG